MYLTKVFFSLWSIVNRKIHGVFWMRLWNQSVKINLFKPNILHYYRQCFAIFRAEPWYHQYRTSVVSGWKIESSGFHRPLLKPAKFHEENSAEIEASGGLRVLWLGYTVDASERPNQVFLIFGESSKMCVIERCLGGSDTLPIDQIWSFSVNRLS